MPFCLDSKGEQVAGNGTWHSYTLRTRSTSNKSNNLASRLGASKTLIRFAQLQNLRTVRVTHEETILWAENPEVAVTADTNSGTQVGKHGSQVRKRCSANSVADETVQRKKPTALSKPKERRAAQENKLTQSQEIIARPCVWRGVTVACSGSWQKNQKIIGFCAFDYHQCKLFQKSLGIKFRNDM